MMCIINTITPHIKISDRDAGYRGGYKGISDNKYALIWFFTVFLLLGLIFL